MAHQVSNPDKGGRRASRLPYVVATAFMGLMVVAAWMGRGHFRPVIAGEPAPPFTVQNLQGDTVRLEEYRGKVLLVNIWATWCPPCREEMPSMQRLYEEIGHEDFEILAVSVDAAPGEGQPGRPGASKAEIRAFAEERDLTFPILHNPSGDIQRTYQTTGVPESFIIGRDGVIYRKISGATVWDHAQYRELIQRLLES